MNRLLRLCLLCMFAFFSQTASAEATTSPTEVLVIVIKASRFVYSPNKISLKTGQTVVLEIEATDRLHGFSIPGLNVRVDAPPGQKISVKLTPDKAGRYIFLCDIFCGSGHEEMAGEIVVEG